MHPEQRAVRITHGDLDVAAVARALRPDFHRPGVVGAEGALHLIQGVRAIESPGHTAGHMSMLIELPKGPPILLAGDAADLEENLVDEIAPGVCWEDREDMAIDSIRKLKQLANETGAIIWPNHDMHFYKNCRPFPEFYE